MDTLKILIDEFKEQLPMEEETTKRELKFPDAPNLIRVAIGMRRTGKTYFIFQKIRELLKQGIPFEQILYLNFEDERLLPLSQKELGQLLDLFYSLYPDNHDKLCYLFLDEIQNVEGWPLVVRRFYDSKNVRIFLTGSSAKLLSKEIATSLRGRSIATEVLPYSFSEYCHAQSIPISKAPYGNKKLDTMQHTLQEYMSRGGFPGVQYLHENERRTVLQTYVDTVIFRDVVERHKITNTALIKYLIKSLIQNVSSSFSISKFYKDIKSQGFKVGKDTLYHYIDYLEDAFLIFTVPLFSESIRKRQSNPKKIYLIDNGLVQANSLNFDSNIGNLFENQVYLDLRREGKKIYYYQTENGYEVDLLAQSLDGSMELIQVAWDIDNKKTYERELRALNEAKKELGIEGRIIDRKTYWTKS